MIGDKMLIYDRDSKMFFAGWRNRRDSDFAIWSRTLNGATVLQRLAVAYDIKERLGGGVRIVSETEAKQIEAMRIYLEEKNGTKAI